MERDRSEVEGETAPRVVRGLQLRGQPCVSAHALDTTPGNRRPQERRRRGNQFRFARQLRLVPSTLGGGQPVFGRAPLTDSAPRRGKGKFRVRDDLLVGEAVDPSLEDV